jgi:hypothetical protein
MNLPPSTVLTLSEVLQSPALLTILQIFCPAEERSLRRYSETAAVAVGEMDEPGTGHYLVEAADGLELLEIIAVQEGLCLSADGRGFPVERAQYAFVIVQLASMEKAPFREAENDQAPGQKREVNDGYPADQA